MTPAEFEAGIARLVGIFKGGISETLVKELDNRYRRYSAGEFDALVSRVLETSKSCPRLAHFIEQETGSARLPIQQLGCGLCSNGYSQRYFMIRSQPYSGVVPCPCSPQLKRYTEQLPGVKLQFISQDQFLEACKVRRDEAELTRKPKQPITRCKVTQGKPDATNSDATKESIEERKSIQAEGCTTQEERWQAFQEAVENGPG